MAMISKRMGSVRNQLVKVWQYQLEWEGGERFGPGWMHLKQAQKYLKERPIAEQQRLHIAKFWIEGPKRKFAFKGVKAEYVRGG